MVIKSDISNPAQVIIVNANWTSNNIITVTLKEKNRVNNFDGGLQKQA